MTAQKTGHSVSTRARNRSGSDPSNEPLAASRIKCFRRKENLIREAASGKRRGFTLVEAMIASVFLAITVVGVASALTASSYESQQIDESSNAQALARELLEEMTSKSFATQPNPGFSSGGVNRANYDDVADYDGYTDNTGTGITTLQGTTINLGDNVIYTRTAAFEYRATPDGSKASSGDFGLATVTVSTPEGTSVTLQRLLSSPVLLR